MNVVHEILQFITVRAKAIHHDMKVIPRFDEDGTEGLFVYVSMTDDESILDNVSLYVHFPAEEIQMYLPNDRIQTSEALDTALMIKRMAQLQVDIDRRLPEWNSRLTQEDLDMFQRSAA